MENLEFEQLILKVENNEHVCVTACLFDNDQLERFRSAETFAYIKDCDVVHISLYAEAYYSGEEYTENIYMLTSDYKKYIYGQVYVADSDMLNCDECCRVYVGELDGKHSEVYGDISVEPLLKSELETKLLDRTCDGDYLENYLFEGNKEALEICNKNFEKLLSGIDTTIEVSVRIKRSQRDRLDKFIAQLKSEQ